MSQHTSYSSADLDPWNQEINSNSDLLQIFTKAQKSKNKFMIGLEYEIFVLTDKNLSPILFVGTKSIENLFKHLVKKSNNLNASLKPIYDNQHIVALENKDTVIALEPGGQLEIAAKPQLSLHECINNFSSIINLINDSCKDLDLYLLSLGFHPKASISQMAHVPKSRYNIMQNYMPKVGSMGLDMMYRTCSIQINLDYENEADMVKKMRLAALLSPMLGAISSSGAFYENKPIKQSAFRAHIWQNTDKQRSGIPECIFSSNFSYATWIEFVLDVPMYFIRRNDEYIDMSHKSFRDFIKNGYLNHRATIRDFIDHMSTVFTEVRLKPFIELRSIDCLPVIFVNAISALTWCLFYDDNIRQQAEKILSPISYQELVKLNTDIVENGCNSLVMNKSIFNILEQIVSLTNNSEYYKIIKPIHDLIIKKTTAAQWIKDHKENYEQDNQWLLKHFSPLSANFL